LKYSNNKIKYISVGYSECMHTFGVLKNQSTSNENAQKFGYRI